MKNEALNKLKDVSQEKAARSRKSGTKANQREQIVITASKLFHERGYTKTSLSEIARQIGLDQSSIYYWFPSKEAILESIYDPNSTVPAIQVITEKVTDRVEQLYMLIAYDVVRKCELPFDFLELETLVQDHPEKYQGLLKSYAEYYQAIENTINQGIEEGVFKECLVDEQVVTILSVSEGLQHHYHNKQRHKLILVSCGYTVKDHSPVAVGHMAARTILPGMLCEPQDMDELQARAIEHCEALQLHSFLR